MSSAFLDMKRKQFKTAKSELTFAVKLHFPIGAEVFYQHASNQRSLRCIVHSHGYDADVRIKVIDSGRLIWVRGGMDERLV